MSYFWRSLLLNKASGPGGVGSSIPGKGGSRASARSSKPGWFREGEPWCSRLTSPPFTCLGWWVDDIPHVCTSGCGSAGVRQTVLASRLSVLGKEMKLFYVLGS